MAGDWIPMRHDLPDDPAVIAISAKLGIEEDHVVGKLHRLWSWADRHTVDGNAVGVTKNWLDRFLGMAGFADCLCGVGWLVADRGGIQIPKFDGHISQSAKQRALTNRRVSNHRKRKCNAPSVTESLPEKRREEKRREEKKSRVESSRVDHTSSRNEERKNLVLACAGDLFGGKDPVLGGRAGMKPADEDLLLKVAALLADGKLSQDTVVQALESVRRHSTPVRNRVALFRSVLADRAGGTGALNKLLAKMQIPEGLARAKP